MKKTDSTLSHPVSGMGEAIRRMSYFISFLAIFFAFSIAEMNAQSPTDLGEELTEEVKQEFKDELTYLDEQTDHEELMEYLEQVEHTFDQGTGLRQSFRTHAGNIFNVTDDGSPTYEDNSSLQNTKAPTDDYDEFLQLTENIELSIGDLGDLTAIFVFF